MPELPIASDAEAWVWLSEFDEWVKDVSERWSQPTPYLFAKYALEREKKAARDC